MNICLEYGKSGLIPDEVRGMIVCELCVYVASKRTIDSGAEWRVFTLEEKS